MVFLPLAIYYVSWTGLNWKGGKGNAFPRNIWFLERDKETNDENAVTRDELAPAGRESWNRSYEIHVRGPLGRFVLKFLWGQKDDGGMAVGPGGFGHP